jgi:hypothetical protein
VARPVEVEGDDSTARAGERLEERLGRRGAHHGDRESILRQPEGELGHVLLHSSRHSRGVQEVKQTDRRHFVARRAVTNMIRSNP